MHYLHNVVGSLAWKYRARETFNKCWCLRSITEFCCSRSTQEYWCRTPFSRKKSVNWSSLALSDRNTLMVLWNWVSIMQKNPETTCSASDLFLSNKTHVQRIQSSTKVRKYWNPEWKWHDTDPKYCNEVNQRDVTPYGFAKKMVIVVV